MTFRYLGIPSETHLPDRLALRLLVQTFRPELIDRLVDKAERRERRRRLLPAQLMMYFALAMWLFGASSYEEVLAKLTGGLPEMFQGVGDLATAAAIARARMRLGVEPLKALCGHVAASAGRRSPPDDERVFVFESVAMEAPDTPANRVAYGVAETKDQLKGRALDVWLASLTDCRLRASAVAAITPSRESGVEGVLSEWPHDLLGAGALVVGDQELVTPALWQAVTESGAHQIWWAAERGPARRHLPVERELPDGSYLSTLGPDGPARGSGSGTVVRVVPRAAGAGPVRAADPGARPLTLVTSILDDSVTAEEISARHARVAELCRSGVGQFTAQIAGPRVVLRSKSPELVQQEIYAMLCTYHAVGHLVSPMYSADLLSDEERGPVV